MREHALFVGGRCAVLMFLCALLAVVSDARAQCSSTWITAGGFPGVDTRFEFPNVSVVRDSLEWDEDGDGPLPPVIVVCGTFTQAGTINVANIAAWDGERWQPFGGGLATLGGPVHEVGQIAVHNGRLYAAGRGEGSTWFVCYWNGFAWMRIGTVTGPIAAMESFGGELFIGGTFTHIDGAPAAAIARWSGSGWSALSGLQPPLYWDMEVNVIFALDELLYLGGAFSGAAGVPSRGVIAWDEAGWHAVGAGVEGGVSAIGSYRGELVVAGSFQRPVGGPENLAYMAKWNGMVWSPVAAGLGAHPGVNGVRAMTEFDGTLYVGGAMTIPFQQSDVLLARLGASSWEAVEVRSNATCVTLREYRGELIVGGAIYGAGALGVGHIASWTGEAWRTLGDGFASERGYMTTAGKVLPTRDGCMVVGNFASFGSIPTLRIAELYKGEWRGFGEGLAFGAWGDVRDLAIHEGEMILAGDFEEVNGVTARNVARWDGSAWRPMGEGFTDVQGRVEAIGRYGDRLIVGGYFRDSGGVTFNSIAEWDGERWLPLGTGVLRLSGPTGTVLALAEYQGKLIAAGRFASAGGRSAESIASWDGERWEPLGPGMNDSVTRLLVHNGYLYACGYFTGVYGVQSGTFTRWDGTRWYQLESVGGGYVLDMIADGDGIILVGNFTSAGGRPTDGLARWTESGVATIGGDFDGHPSRAARLHNGDLVVTGSFFTVNGRPSPAFATLRSGRPRIIEHPSSVWVCGGSDAEFEVEAVSSLPLVTYRWYRDGTAVADGLTPWGSVISGSGSARLLISGLADMDVGEYTCRITNLCGQWESLPGLLEVADCACPADWDRSGGVDGDDIGAFFVDWQEGDADADGSGGTDGDDIGFFFERWQAGC